MLPLPDTLPHLLLSFHLSKQPSPLPEVHYLYYYCLFLLLLLHILHMELLLPAPLSMLFYLGTQSDFLLLTNKPLHYQLLQNQFHSRNIIFCIPLLHLYLMNNTEQQFCQFYLYHMLFLNQLVPTYPQQSFVRL